jgi:hypothetical protein
MALFRCYFDNCDIHNGSLEMTHVEIGIIKKTLEKGHWYNKKSPSKRAWKTALPKTVHSSIWRSRLRTCLEVRLRASPAAGEKRSACATFARPRADESSRVLSHPLITSASA